MHKAWAVMWAAYLASVAVVVNQFKVPPVLDILLNEMQIDLTLGGWLMSVFAVAGVILSLPAALVLDRLGAKLSGMMALACTVIGSTIGGFAANASLLLLGRMIEGIGLGLMAVIAPAIIVMWFPADKRGIPMGMWASWVPVGSFLIFNMANPIVPVFGWRGVWWFGTSIALIALLVYALVVTNPQKAAESKEQRNAAAEVSYKSALKSPAIWLLAVGFGGLGFSNSGLVTWLPSYLNQAHGVSPELANFYTSLSPMVAAVATVTAGWVIDKLQKPKAILLVSSVITAILYGYVFQLGSASLIVPLMLMLGFFPGFFATTTFTLAPEAVPAPQLAGLAMAILNLVFNIGFFLGPPTVGKVINNAQGNWGAGAIPLTGGLLVAITTSLIFARLVKVSWDKKRVKHNSHKD